MAVNGFGTDYIGKYDVKPDGSYITVEFITALYIPVIPIACYRVIEGNKTNLIVYKSTKYVVIGRMPMNWILVRHVYRKMSLPLIGIFGGIILLIWLLTRLV